MYLYLVESPFRRYRQMCKLRYTDKNVHYIKYPHIPLKLCCISEILLKIFLNVRFSSRVLDGVTFKVLIISSIFFQGNVIYNGSSVGIMVV